MFGKSHSGYAFGNKAWEWTTQISDNGEVEQKSGGKIYTGKAWIEEEKICLVRENYYSGLKSCDEVYRNSEGDELTKTEYIRVTDYGFFSFSVEK